LLALFWDVDLTRPFLPLLCASDASTEFGFGGSILPLPAHKIREIARWAEKRGAYVVLDNGERLAAYAARLGDPHILDLAKESFTHVFSIRRKAVAHINVLECHAFLNLIRWILRSRHRHCTRVVVLLDSAVLLGAASKGRSSRALNRLLRKAATLEMAGDLQIHLILVPSDENASDSPSRGVRAPRDGHGRRARLWRHNFMKQHCVSQTSSRQEWETGGDSD